MATQLPQRVPENAPGDFYVERDVCTRCCIPHGEAPELLNDPKVDFRECYFRRQPQQDETGSGTDSVNRATDYGS